MEPPALSQPPRLEVQNLSVRYGAKQALDGVSLAVRAGEVVGLLGENGAGKSTLASAVYGLVRASAGELRLDGCPVRIESPAQARRLGVGMVHQHFALVPDLTVAENLLLEQGGFPLAWLRRRTVEQEARTLAQSLGFALDPRARVANLSIGDQQRVEIVKALRGSARLLLLDEPTASLTPAEALDLLAAVRRLAASGGSILIVSHRLREVLAVADRVIVLRDGRLVAERRIAETSAAELARLMIGTTVERAKGPTPSAAPAREEIAREVCGEEVLALDGFTVQSPIRGRPAAVRGVDLVLHAGEIVGVAGVDGNGQGELAEALVGLRHPSAGALRVGGREIRRMSPRLAASLGIAFVPADRAQDGLAATLAVSLNLIGKHLRRRQFGGPLALDWGALSRFAAERVRTFQIRPPDIAVPAGALSGGNQQRVVLARELAFAPRILVALSPTRGLDVAATEFVHAQLGAAARDGRAVLLFSTDLDEVLALASRVLVMFEGRLTEARSRDAQTLGMLMGGAQPA